MRSTDPPPHNLDGSADHPRNLELVLERIETDGLPSLSLRDARRFTRLYRLVANDLLRARGLPLHTPQRDQLNDLVARAHAVLHAVPPGRRRSLRRFFGVDFPRSVRREWRLVAFAAAVLCLGAAIGAYCVAADPYALGVLIPEDHQNATPSERVRGAQMGGPALIGDSAAAFSGWLFTHNMEVTLLVFALGLTFGLGTVAMLFMNGVPLGALGMQYHLDGQAAFFWAWVLPHGVTELTVVCIAGAAGFGVARGLWLPRRLSRTTALASEARKATAMLFGALPLLAIAGAVEASISQLHPPTLSYTAKLMFAIGLASALFMYLWRAGREKAGFSPKKSRPETGGLS